MSLFPRFHEISPIFRIIDEFDRAARQASPSHQNLPSFNPRFDVREVQDQYELTGELPGIDQKDVNVEWADGNTLIVSGRTEHRTERGTRAESEAATEATETIEAESSTASRQATVEDDTDDLVQVEKPEDESNEVAAPATKEVSTPAESKAKYWVTERSVGQFRRTFRFPARIDQDSVKASLRDGVLNIVVPKVKAKEPRRINIE